MKKLTAMLLALCMLLAVVPALAESESAAGNWYMSLADVTLGYILLNEDGTAVVNVASQEDIPNTWTQDGATVTITAENQPIDFAFDGASLSSPEFPLALTREQGKLPMDVISAMMAGKEYTLPEGVTEADMTTIAMNFMAEYTKLMAQASTGEDTGDTGASVAEQPAGTEAPIVTIEKSTFLVTESYSGYRGRYIARIKNENDVPLFLEGGSLQVFDKDGNQVGEATYLYDTGSKYLEPGETSFVNMTADLESDGEYTYKANIETRTQSYRSTDVALKVADPVYVKAEDQYGSDLIKATVYNETDASMAGIEMVLVLVDADGNLLDIHTENLYRNELGAHSSFTVVTTVDSKVTEYCQANGLEPATVEAYAWVENED